MDGVHVTQFDDVIVVYTHLVQCVVHLLLQELVIFSLDFHFQNKNSVNSGVRVTFLQLIFQCSKVLRITPSMNLTVTLNIN